MKEITVQNQTGASVGSVPIPSLLVEGEIHGPVVHQVVVAHLANRRQGTASTKERSEVRGSGRKLFRQKGLGRARMGDIRSPLRVGGGTVFGPRPRSYRQKTPRKMKRLALLSVLRDKFQNDAVRFIDGFPAADERPRTKAVAETLRALELADRKVLIVLPEPNTWVLRSSRNLPKVDVTTSALLNAYDVLTHDVLLMLPASVDVLAERLGATEEAVAVEEVS